MELVSALLKHIDEWKNLCDQCDTEVEKPIFELVNALLTKRTIWRRDLLESSGAGRYSILTLGLLEGAFERLAEKGLGLLVVNVVDLFPEWETEAAAMKRVMREHPAPINDEGNKPTYRAHVPMDGMPPVLILL